MGRATPFFRTAMPSLTCMTWIMLTMQPRSRPTAVWRKFHTRISFSSRGTGKTPASPPQAARQRCARAYSRSMSCRDAFSVWPLYGQQPVNESQSHKHTHRPGQHTGEQQKAGGGEVLHHPDQQPSGENSIQGYPFPRDVVKQVVAVGVGGDLAGAPALLQAVLSNFSVGLDGSAVIVRC